MLSFFLEVNNTGIYNFTAWFNSLYHQTIFFNLHFQKMEGGIKGGLAFCDLIASATTRDKIMDTAFLEMVIDMGMARKDSCNTVFRQ